MSTAAPLHCDGCGLEIMNEICSNSASPERIYHPECFERLGRPLTPLDEAAIRRIVREEIAADKPAQQQRAIRCPEKLKNGGVCPHHNLQCGWPQCNEEQA